MNSIAYITMMQQMEAGAYTEVEAKNTLEDLYTRQRLTHDEYIELMDKADTLAVNTPDGDTLARIVSLEITVKTLSDEVTAIKQAVEGGSTVVPEPDQGATGAEMDPIDAVAGMTYTKDLYYRDPANGEVYQCTKTVEGWAGLPHEAVNVYFNWARKE